MVQVGSGPAEARRASELAAWQAVLPSLYPEIAGEAVLDVVAISSGRILLLTAAHIAMLKVPLLPSIFESQKCRVTRDAFLMEAKIHSVYLALENAICNGRSFPMEQSF